MVGRLAEGVTLKYTYPEDLPEYRPRPRKNQVYSSDSSAESSVDEYIGTFTSNDEYMRATESYIMREGNAQITGKVISCKLTNRNH